MSYDLDDIIEHYGVKGMKWGVRKDPDRVSARKQRRSDRKAAKKDKKTQLKNAKITYGKKVAKADETWYKELAKTEKANPKLDANKVIFKTLESPLVKKTQADVQVAKKEIKRISKQPLSEFNKPQKKKVDLSLLLTDDDIAELQAEWNRIERSEGKKPTKLIIEE